jgi:hypothetical protein
MAWHGHLARDSLRHFVGKGTFFTGKMPVPRYFASPSAMRLGEMHVASAFWSAVA